MSEFFKIIEYEIKKDSNEEYHSKKEFISCSGLKKIKKSPLHYREEENNFTEAKAFGSAYHTFILEPELFETEYYIFDDSAICSILIGEGAKSPRATKNYKDWYDSEMRVANGRPTVDTVTYNMLIAMRDRLMRHRYVKSLLSKGEAEMSVYCTIQIMTGQIIKVKIRPDYNKKEKRIVSDLKSTKDASKEGFPKVCGEFDYHLQAALYSDIMNEIEGVDLGWDFFFIAQEKTKPFAFNIFESSPQFIAQGRYEYEQLLMLYAWCLENDTWPGYQCFTENRFGVNELNLPTWSVKEINWFAHKF
jgi:exodeoxyribonuclease VIII